MRAGQGFPANAAPGSVIGRGDNCGHCLSLDGFWGCSAQQEQQGCEGRATHVLTSLRTPDLTPPHQGSPVPKQSLPRLVLKTWKVRGLEDMQKTNSVKQLSLC